MVTGLDKNTALILIDLQKGIVGYPTVNPINEVIANAVKLVDAFHKVGLPVAVVNVDPTLMKHNTRKDAGSMGNRQLPEDWLDIIPEIVIQPGDFFITKHTWGAFFETTLEQELRERNITGIVLAGVSTSIGVEGTARQANDLGYNITFAADAMTDMVAEAQENSIKNIFPRMGEIGDTEKIIEKLQ